MTATRKPARKVELYAAAVRHGKDAAFVANVIINWQSSPTRRLAGLVKLLDRGRDVRTGSFSIDTLLVDGEVVEWSSLEAVK